MDKVEFAENLWKRIDSRRIDSEMRWGDIIRFAKIPNSTLRTARDLNRVPDFHYVACIAEILNCSLEDLNPHNHAISYSSSGYVLDSAIKTEKSEMASRFWKTVERYLLSKSITWAGFAESIGMPRATLASAKNANRCVTFDFMVAVAEGMGCTPDELLIERKIEDKVPSEAERVCESEKPYGVSLNNLTESEQSTLLQLLKKALNQ